VTQCANNLTAGEQVDTTTIYFDSLVPFSCQDTMLEIKNLLQEALEDVDNVEFKLRCEYDVGDKMPSL
jgi:hypothetical protein